MYILFLIYNLISNSLKKRDYRDGYIDIKGNFVYGLKTHFLKDFKRGDYIRIFNSEEYFNFKVKYFLSFKKLYKKFLT
jgi:hypothetical protein